MGLILKRNFCFDVNGRLDTLYMCAFSPRHVIRSSDNVQIYPPIDGIKFPWSGEEESGDKKKASEAPTRKVCDLGSHSMLLYLFSCQFGAL